MRGTHLRVMGTLERTAWKATFLTDTNRKARLMLVFLSLRTSMQKSLDQLPVQGPE